MKCKFCRQNSIEFYYNGRPRKKVGVFIAEKRKYFKCKSCLSIFQDLSDFDLNRHSKYFSSGTYSNQVNLKSNLNSRNILKNLSLNAFRENVNYLSFFNFNLIYNKKILDFGCGSGNFLKFLYLFSDDNKFIKIGIDPIYNNIKIKNLPGIKFFTDLKKSDKICKKFDLITSFSTLCTQPQLNDLFKSFSERLKKNGLLVIGDINPIDIRLKNKRYNKIFFRDSCLNYVSEKGFKSLASQYKFKHLKTSFSERYDYNNLLRYLGLPFLKSIGINKLNYKNHVEKKGQSDYFFIVFQKE